MSINNAVTLCVRCLLARDHRLLFVIVPHGVSTRQAVLFEAQTLLDAENDIHILNRLAGRAFYKIVNC